MRTKNSVSTILFAGILSALATACNSNSDTASRVSVNKDVVVEIYSTIDRGEAIDTVSPCLLKETVHISELLHYSDDEGMTMPFNFSDTAKYAEITESNLGKRIAISVNGKVVSTPVVKMKLDNGACSVVLDDAQIATLFPKVTN